MTNPGEDNLVYCPPGDRFRTSQEGATFTAEDKAKRQSQANGRRSRIEQHVNAAHNNAARNNAVADMKEQGKLRSLANQELDFLNRLNNQNAVKRVAH